MYRCPVCLSEFQALIYYSLIQRYEIAICPCCILIVGKRRELKEVEEKKENNDEG